MNVRPQPKSYDEPMLEYGAQTTMALGDVPQRGDQKIEIIFDFPGDLLAGEDPNPGRRQLHGQREACHQLADTNQAVSIPF